MWRLPPMVAPAVTMAAASAADLGRRREACLRSTPAVGASAAHQPEEPRAFFAVSSELSSSSSESDLASAVAGFVSSCEKALATSVLTALRLVRSWALRRPLRLPARATATVLSATTSPLGMSMTTTRIIWRRRLGVCRRPMTRALASSASATWRTASPPELAMSVSTTWLIWMPASVSAWAKVVPSMTSMRSETMVSNC